MNKKRVEEYLPIALEALNNEKCGIQEKKDKKFTGRIPKTLRGQISSFGAAVTMGSFKAAVAFFSQKGGSSTERQELVKAMYYISTGEWKNEATDVAKAILNTTNKAEINAMKEKFINASLAIKLAMNAFDLIETK